VEELDAVPVALRAQARSIGAPGYDGRRSGVITGAAGEWLELIETGGNG
jgi:hypothetical protein